MGVPYFWPFFSFAPYFRPSRPKVRSFPYYRPSLRTFGRRDSLRFFGHAEPQPIECVSYRPLSRLPASTSKSQAARLAARAARRAPALRRSAALLCCLPQWLARSGSSCRCSSHCANRSDRAPPDRSTALLWPTRTHSRQPRAGRRNRPSSGPSWSTRRTI